MKTEETAVRLLQRLREQGLTLATAESCTGGWIGQTLTAVPGSSASYLGGVIAYANSVKEAVLGVPAQTLQEHGAVSAQTAAAMAQGVRRVIGADLSVAVTGIAGPGSDGTGKPVGLVYMGICDGVQTKVTEHHFSGDREAVRRQTVEAALQTMLQFI